MTQIEQIKAEIERLKAEIPYHENAWSVLNKLKEFINSLPDEQPSEDLKEAAIKEAHKRYKDCPALNIGGDYEFAEYHEEERELFVEGALWGANCQKEKDINKACDWLNQNVVEYHPRTGKLRPIVNINAFREAMNSENF